MPPPPPVRRPPPPPRTTSPTIAVAVPAGQLTVVDRPAVVNSAGGCLSTRFLLAAHATHLLDSISEHRVHTAAAANQQSLPRAVLKCFVGCALCQSHRFSLPHHPARPTPDSLPPPTAALFCGGGRLGNGVCQDSGACCSRWGHCGRGYNYCRCAGERLWDAPSKAVGDACALTRCSGRRGWGVLYLTPCTNCLLPARVPAAWTKAIAWVERAQT